MQDLSTTQQKKLEKMLKVMSKGGSDKDLEIVDLISDLEDKVDAAIAQIQEPVHGVDGEDYVLTDEDKAEIASKITVPVVEKVIEKTETIIRETPKETIIERIIEKPIVTNETKEVAVLDPDQLPSYGAQFRDGLETLVGDERLEKDAIRGITVSNTPPLNPQYGDIWIALR